MQLQLNFFLYVLFCNIYYLVNVKALIGTNIRRAQPDEFPSVVSILRRTGQNLNPNTDLVCSGTLISSQNVLTSEHCIENEQLTGVQIIAGSNNFLEGLRYHPTWWIAFDQWRIQMGKRIRVPWNDIAIIRLNSNVSSEIPFAIFSTLKPKDLFGAQVVSVGWGQSNNASVSMYLHAATLSVLTRTNCKSKVSNLSHERINIDERLLCTVANPYILLNEGDSGGPVFYEGTVIGVNSGTCPFPEDFFHPEKVNLHFSVYYYDKFIKFMIEY